MEPTNKEPPIKVVDGTKYFYRFTANQRVQHGILAITVVLLVLTGMPLKFYDRAWAEPLSQLMGGLDSARAIHRVAGAALVILFLYHVVYLLVLIWRGQIAPLWRKKQLTAKTLLKVLLEQPLAPNLKDARDIRDLLKYLLYMTTERPKGARFTWKEKADYWAPFWGMAVIGTTGIIMWNFEASTQYISGELINYSLIAHSEEALLAALFLFMWHWYNVHFSASVFPMSNTFLSGYMPEEIMVEEHYEQYVELMTEAGLTDEILPPHGSENNHNHSHPKPKPKPKPEPEEGVPAGIEIPASDATPSDGGAQ